MSFLGLCLFFAGIALIMNGAVVIPKWDARSAAFSNHVTGSTLVTGNFTGLSGVGASVILKMYMPVVRNSLWYNTNDRA